MPNLRLSPHPTSESLLREIWLSVLFILCANAALAQLLPGDIVVLQDDRIIAVQPTGGLARVISSPEVGSINTVIFDSQSGRQIIFPEMSSIAISRQGAIYTTGAGHVWLSLIHI